MDGVTRRGFVLGAAGLLVPLAGAGRAAAAGAVQPAQVQTWGSNDAQQLGRRTRYLTDVAGPVPGLGDVGQVAAFGSSTYVVRQDGTVLGWASGAGRRRAGCRG